MVPTHSIDVYLYADTTALLSRRDFRMVAGYPDPSPQPVRWLNTTFEELGVR